MSEYDTILVKLIKKGMSIQRKVMNSIPFKWHNFQLTNTLVRKENNEYNNLQKCDLLIIDDFASEKIQIAQTAESLQWLLRQRTIDHMNVKGNKPRCTILLCQYPRCEWSTQIVNENLKQIIYLH